MTPEEQYEMRWTILEAFGSPRQVFGDIPKGRALLDALDAAERRAEEAEQQLTAVEWFREANKARADRDRWREIAGELAEALGTSWTPIESINVEESMRQESEAAELLARYDEMAK